MMLLDKLGWPVEFIENRPVTNFIRAIIHGRSLITKAEWKRRWAARRPAPDTDITMSGPNQ